MALRLYIGRFGKTLFRPTPLNSLVCRHRSNLTPMAGWFDKPKSLLFHPDNMLKHAEVIPIAVIAALGLLLDFVNTVRLAFTRDDVRFLNKKMACEQIETRVGPMYPAPIRKNRTYNQQYETPKGLLRAIQTAADEEEAS